MSLTSTDGSIGPDEFRAQYLPVVSPLGDTLWTTEEIRLGRIPANCVWSLDYREDGIYAEPGLHVHDGATSLMVTEEPWRDVGRHALWAKFE